MPTTKKERRGRNRRRSGQSRGPSDFRKIVKKFVPVSEIKVDKDSVFYGKAGTGKTTLACTYPKPILLLDFKEKGTDSVIDVDDVTVLQVSEWQEVEDVYWFLESGEHKFKTVIWDTVSQAQDLGILETIHNKRLKIDDPGGWGTMNKGDWGSVSGRMKEWITNYKELKGIIAVFIAHDRTFDDEGSEDDDFEITPSVGPRVMPSVASHLNASCNIEGNLFIRERFVKVKSKRKKKIEEKRVVDYCLRIGPHGIYVTKIRKPKRVKLPDIITDPSYDKLMAIIKETTDGPKSKGKRSKKEGKRPSKLRGRRNKTTSRRG